MDSSRRIRRRRLPQLLAISVLVVGATLSPAEALTKPLDRVATGQALAEVCNAANERELDVVDVFGDIEDSSPPARWRAYIDEIARIQTKTQAAFLAIKPQPGVDGGLTTKINALIARETDRKSVV